MTCRAGRQVSPLVPKCLFPVGPENLVGRPGCGATAGRPDQGPKAGGGPDYESLKAGGRYDLKARKVLETAGRP